MCRLQFIRNFCFYYYCWCFGPSFFSVFFCLFFVINVIIRFGPLSIIVYKKGKIILYVYMHDGQISSFYLMANVVNCLILFTTPRALIPYTFTTRYFMLQWIFFYSAYQQQQQQLLEHLRKKTAATLFKKLNEK